MNQKTSNLNAALLFASGILLALVFWIVSGYIFSTLFNYAISETFNLPQLDTRHAMGVIMLGQILKWNYPTKDKTTTVNNIMLPEIPKQPKEEVNESRASKPGNA